MCEEVVAVGVAVCDAVEVCVGVFDTDGDAPFDKLADGELVGVDVEVGVCVGVGLG